MELSEFEQMDIRLAQVAAAQQLGLMISKRTGQLIAEIMVVNGRWRCFVPGRGWVQASDLLFGGKPVASDTRADFLGAGERLQGGARLVHRIMKFVRKIAIC